MQEQELYLSCFISPVELCTAFGTEKSPNEYCSINEQMSKITSYILTFLSGILKRLSLQLFQEQKA